MDPIASFSGLASGIQWRDMVDQIMALEARPADALRTRVSLTEQRSKAWADFRTRVQALNDAATALTTGGKLNARKALLTGLPFGAAAPFLASATQDAIPASYAIKVNRLATQEKLGGAIFASRSTALNVAGEFLINGRHIELQATDSLDTIARRINDSNTGTAASGVSASVLTSADGSYRLVLTSSRSGAAGIDLRDASGGALHALGLLDGTAQNKHVISNGVQSDAFTDSSTTIATLLGLTAATPAATLNVGGRSVAVDLATQSLEQIQAAINVAAAGTNITATIVADTVGGAAVQRLQIANTTNLAQSDADAQRIAELLGLLQAGRPAVAAQLQSSALTDGDGTTAITASSQWQNLWLKDGAQNAGVTDGDRLTIAGQYDDTTFNFEYSIVGTNSIDDLLTQLNGADGFNGQATASISAAGRIVVIDNTAGERRLSLSAVAHNDGGGSLDLGDMITVTNGRNTVIEAGRDAQFEIDGTVISRASNTITDVVAGLTLNLTSTYASAVTVTVGRDDTVSSAAIHGFVDAYNALEEFVDAQLAPPAAGSAAPPLYGNAALRTLRATLRASMERSVSSSVAGAYTRLATIGSEIDQTGKYGKNASKLQAALLADPESVIRLLAPYGSTTSGTLTYNRASDLTQAGTYAVNITQAAARARLAGIGFSGTYVDDGVADTMIVRDLGSNREYQIQLTANTTIESIISSLNSEFARTTRHAVASMQTLHGDGIGTPAGDATTWAAVRDSNGIPANVATNDIITIGGMRPDGRAFSVDYVVTDAATSTLGEFRAAIQAAVGPDVEVALANGVITATDRRAGSSLLSLTLTPQNNSGGTLDFGGMAVATTGRGQAGITASVDPGVPNQLQLEHGDYGLAAGFEVQFVAGGSDSTAQLGIAAGIYSGTDMQGTIGGLPATGTGAQLTGNSGTAVDGLVLSYTGAIGSAGTVTFSRGIASMVETAARTMLGSGAGSIDALTAELADSIRQYNSRIDTLETRLDHRRETLIRRFTAMEQAMARAQTQSAWLTAQFAQFDAKKK